MATFQTGYPRKIISMLIIVTFSVSLAAISEVNDEWSDSCLRECSGGAAGPDCNISSIKFIADQYVRAMKGEPYWKSSGERKFGSSAECAEFRFLQLRAICPSAADDLRKSIR